MLKYVSFFSPSVDKLKAMLLKIGMSLATRRSLASFFVLFVLFTVSNSYMKRTLLPCLWRRRIELLYSMSTIWKSYKMRVKELTISGRKARIVYSTGNIHFFFPFFPPLPSIESEMTMTTYINPAMWCAIYVIILVHITALQRIFFFRKHSRTSQDCVEYEMFLNLYCTDVYTIAIGIYILF